MYEDCETICLSLFSMKIAISRMKNGMSNYLEAVFDYLKLASIHLKCT